MGRRNDPMEAAIECLRRPYFTHPARPYLSVLSSSDTCTKHVNIYNFQVPQLVLVEREVLPLCLTINALCACVRVPVGTIQTGGIILGTFPSQTTLWTRPRLPNTRDRAAGEPK